MDLDQLTEFLADVISEHQAETYWTGPECAETACSCGRRTGFFYGLTASDESMDDHALHVASEQVSAMREHLAEVAGGLGLRTEFGARYDQRDLSGTVETPMSSREAAEQAVRNPPINDVFGWRVVRRLVTEWSADA